MAIRTGTFWLLLLVAALAAGCSPHYHHVHSSSAAHPVIVTEDTHRHGPPPHAPAHGYRHKHEDGEQLRYDSRLGVYVVLGHDDTWFVDDLYLRWSRDGWMASARIDTGWAAISVEKVPVTLREKKSKGHGKHKHGH